MAQRRMVSVKIIDSAKFIKMPASTQALYFHLLARADDDGIVEAFNVMRMTGSAEDDLKVLTAKEFVKILNEDLVAYITDWHEHNLIRADRKVDSIYQNLLLQIVGDVEIKEKKERADRRKQILLTDGTSQGQPTDGIGKDSVVKSRKGKVKDIAVTCQHLTMSTDEYAKLCELYGKQIVDIKIEYADNYAKLKNYSSLSKTLNNWLKSDLAKEKPQQQQQLKTQETPIYMRSFVPEEIADE